MSSEAGSIYIEFKGDKTVLGELSGYISETTKAHLPGRDEDEDKKWMFLSEYDEARRVLDNELVFWDALNEDTIKGFFTEVAKRYPAVGFEGDISHSWMSFGDDATRIDISHLPNEEVIHWDVTTNPDGEDEDTDYQTIDVRSAEGKKHGGKAKDSRKKQLLDALPAKFGVKILDKNLEKRLKVGMKVRLTGKDEDLITLEDGTPIGPIVITVTGLAISDVRKYIRYLDAHIIEEPSYWEFHKIDIIGIEFYEKGQSQEELTNKRNYLREKRINETKERTLRVVPSFDEVRNSSFLPSRNKIRVYENDSPELVRALNSAKDGDALSLRVEYDDVGYVNLPVFFASGVKLGEYHSSNFFGVLTEDLNTDNLADNDDVVAAYIDYLKVKIEKIGRVSTFGDGRKGRTVTIVLEPK